jgi:hypothetical protein
MDEKWAKGRHRAADQTPGHVEVGVASDVDVRAERDLGRVTPGVGRCLASQVERPGEAVGVGADGQGDLLGRAGGEVDDPRPRRRHVERHPGLAGPVEPLEPAGVPVAVDRALAEVGLHVGDQGREPSDRHGLAPQVEQGGVAPADAQHEPPAGGLLHRGGDVGERRGVTRVRVGHARGEPEPVGGRSRQGHRHEGIAHQVLRVGERDAVPASLLGALGLSDHRARLGYACGPELHAHLPL